MSVTNEFKELVVRAPGDVLKILREACDWAGVSGGRGLDYEKIFEEFTSKNIRSRNHLLVYSELMDIVEIYELWKEGEEELPGLRGKIKNAISKGPFLCEDERPNNSSNRPRNDAFAFLMAGKLNRAGIVIKAIEEDFDIEIDHDGLLVGIECKRPQSQKALGTNVRAARKQLGKAAVGGIIAVDCSVVIRTPGTILESPSAEAAVQFLIKELETKVSPTVESEMRPNIWGAILYARVPVHTRTAISSILSPRGVPITTFRQDSVTALVFLGNSASKYCDVIKSIKERFDQWN